MGDEQAPFSQAERELKQIFNQLVGIPRHAFTLVELSIVLVIIALVASGVMVGRELIQQGKLRQIVKEVEEYRLAAQTFKTKYGNFPGDMPRGKVATFFPSASMPGNCSGAGGTGNGNGGLNSNETYCFWWHLAAAKMVDFQPQQSNVPDVHGNRAGVTVPASAYSASTGWLASTWSNIYTNAVPPNMLYLAAEGGTEFSGGRYRFYGGALSAMEAYSIDAKVDDGKPNAKDTIGGVASWAVKKVGASQGYFKGGGSQNCVTGGVWNIHDSYKYNVTDETAMCQMFFPLGE